LLAQGRYRLPVILAVALWYLFGDLRKVFISSILLIGLSPIAELRPAIGWRVDEYLLPVLLARCIVWISSRRSERRPLWLAAPVAVYVTALWISSIATAPTGLEASPHLSARYYLFTLTKPVQLAAWFFIAQQLLRDQQVRRWAAAAVTVALLAVCFIGVGQYLDLWGMRQVISDIYPVQPGPGAILSAAALGERRATSTFAQPNWFASFIVAAVPFVLMLGALVRPAARLGLVVLSVPAVFFALCYSGSRGGMFATIFGLLALAALRLGRGRSVVASGAIPVLAVGAILLAPYFAAPQQREFGIMAKRYPTSPGFMENMLADPRLPAWRYFAEVFSRHPFFGDGAAEIVDNQYLFILARYGLVSFIPFLVLLGYLLRTGWLAWRRHRAGPGEVMAAAALAGMLAVLINGITDAPLQTHRTMELFWLQAAFAAVLAFQQVNGRRLSQVPNAVRGMPRLSTSQVNGSNTVPASNSNWPTVHWKAPPGDAAHG
jgi:hypothetical protein